MATRIINGDSLQVLKTMEDESVNCVITSPPYYKLRDYGMDDQIGQEDTPEEYVEKIVNLFREVRRVLKNDGTLWINIGDSYAANRTYQGKETMGTKGHIYSKGSTVPSGCKPKDLIGIPWMVALALRADGWYLRQDIIWQKTNCMPESVKDRCTRSHEYIFLLSKKPQYYFDAEAISEPISGSSTKRYLQNLEAQKGSDRQPGKSNGSMKAVLPRFGGSKYGEDQKEENRTKSGDVFIPTLRRNKRDVWAISTAGFKGAHFATFPEALVKPCLLAGCPEGGVALDPFAGAATVGVVCKKHNRDFIGIELNPEYAAMGEKRIAETPAPSEYEQMTFLT